MKVTIDINELIARMSKNGYDHEDQLDWSGCILDALEELYELESIVSKAFDEREKDHGTHLR